MTHTARRSWLGLLSATLCAWFVFGALWWAPLIYFEGLRGLQDSLPTPTYWVVVAARGGVPWVLAVAYTLVFVALFLRPGPRAARTIGVMAGLAAVLAAIALVSLALPLQLCAFHWPALPWETPAPPGQACRLDG